jgi:hypothetical protein
MPRIKSKGGMIGPLVDREISGNPELLNAIDFIESRQGFNIKLYPIQRLIVKCIFAVPVDYNMGKVPMYDMFREKLLRIVSEEECLHILYEEGRALEVNEPIPTPNGFVKIGDLKIGDTVFSQDGKPTEVCWVQEPFMDDVYRVSFDDGTSVLAHGEHLWETSSFREKHARYLYGSKNRPVYYRSFSTKTTKELMSSLKIKYGKTLFSNHAIKLSNVIEMPPQALPIDPYFLGLWLGDGITLRPGITSADAETVEFLYQYAENLGLQVSPAGINKSAPVYYITTGKRGGDLSSREENPLLKAMNSLGLIGNKHIPDIYLWASASQRLALLQGLLDSDGGASKRGQVEFSNANQELSEGVYILAASLGIKPGWKEKPPPVVRHSIHDRKQRQYRVRWTSPLPVFRLSRKLALLVDTKPKSKSHFRYVTDIVPAGKALVRCISIKHPSGLFLFGKNFNVTHNCNIGDWRDIPEKGYNKACVIAGRRAGKSEVVAGCGGFKLYLLLNHKSPQEYFGLVPNSHIDFTFLAQDDSGSSRLYDKLREGVNRAPFFGPYLKSSSGSRLDFITEADRGKRDITPTINCESRPCTTNATRSPSNVFLALDEFAHFRSEKGSTSDEVYGAATPSCANFHHAELLDGTWISKETQALLESKDYREFQDSLILSISSPWTKVGKMYDLHRLALDKGESSDTFTMRVSTAEMNPGILPKFLRGAYEENPLTFRAEYGGQFLDSSESYVTESQIRACTDVQYTEEPFPKPILSTARLNLTSFHPSCIGRRYFWGVDLGMMNNATAVAIGHLEHRGGKNRMMVGEKFEGPGVPILPGITKYVGYKALPIDDIIQWLRALNRVMPCFRGATDQHGGQQLIQNLELNDIKHVELVNITTAINSQMAFALKGYIDNLRCRFPFVPKFMDELRLVEAEFVGNYQIRVQAPEERGATDDMCDAVEEVAYVAQKWLIEEGGLKQDPSGSSLAIQEQMMKPAKPIVSLDDVSMQDLKFLERAHKIQMRLMMTPGTTVVKNPFYHRGRR